MVHGSIIYILYNIYLCVCESLNKHLHCMCIGYHQHDDNGYQLC